MKRWFLRGFLSALAASLLLVEWTGCTTVPVTGRRQLNLISDEQAMQLGLNAFQEIKQEANISQDEQANAMVQEVGRRIAAVSDLQDANWEFVVFDNPEPNAFALPGGKVGVNTGLLPVAETPAGLATVIGHEIAHAAARHGSERISQAMMLQTGGQVLGAGLAQVDPRWQAAAAIAYGLTSQVGIALPHSRMQEAEADAIGLIYMARAGYNPQEAIEFWKRFSQKAEKAPGVPAFLRTHPLDQDRIEHIQRLLPEAMEIYEKSRIDAITPE